MKTIYIPAIAIRTVMLLIVLCGCANPTADHIATQNEKSNRLLVKDYGPELALKWCDLELKLIRRKPVFTAPVAARLIGATGIILYESLVRGMPGYRSLSGTLRIPSAQVAIEQNYSYVISANAAFSFALKHFIHSLSEMDLKEIDALENYFNDKYGKETDHKQFVLSANYGRQIAGNIYQWATTDGGEEGKYPQFRAYSVAPALPGMWQATSFAGALLPDWGKNRPFLIANVANCKPPAPPFYSDEKSSELYKEAMEVYNVFSKLTSEQSDIAKFWADPPGSTFTPAGHSIQLLCQIIQKKNLALDSTAIAFAKAGIALNDAFIACWQTKYQYNYIRPITYIRKNIRRDWLSFIPTPSFPEYPSGHSVQAGAMAEILSSLFGNNFSFTDNSNDTLGYQPRHYYSFRECAREAAMSRLYAGIHYRFSIENGLVQGQKIGENVNAISFKEQ